MALIAFGMVATATAAAAAPCAGSALTVVAHEDDDLIFVNPDIIADIQAGRCVRTLFVTAGDAGNPYPDSLYRENAPEAAYAQMAGAADNWTSVDDGVAGRNITVRALVGRPNVSIAFLRLPDGFPSGSGSSTYSGQSLSKLWTGAIPSITSVDGSETYTRAGLISTISAMMTDFTPTVVRTQDYVSAVSDIDHSDHLMTAAFTRAADATYTSTVHTLMAYQGYPTASRPANITGNDLVRKQAALQAASQYDPGAADPWVATMVPRRYVLDTRTGGPGGGNRVPVADAGADQSVSAGSTVTLNGTGSSDPDGDTLTYTWTQTSGPAVTLSSSTASSPTFTAPAAGTSVTFSLVVRDASLSSNPDAVTITVPAAVNHAPVADAGADQSVSAGSTVTLNGTGSSDPDGDTLTYTWTQTSGPAVTLSSSTASSPTFTAPAAGTSVTFSLVVRDASLSSNPDAVTITVPAAGSSNVARTLNATATASTQNTGDGQTAAKAIDGSPLGYPTDYSHEWVSVRQGAGAWLQLTWTNQVTLDRVVLYDRPNTSDQITSGTLTFSDGTSVSVGSLTNDGSAVPIAFAPRSVTWVRLTINTVQAGTSSVGLAEFEAWGVPASGAPTNRAPVADAGADQQVSAGSTVTLSGAASSDPDNDPLTYTWTQTAGAAVNLSSSTAVSPTFTAPAAGTSVTFSLVVRDTSLSSNPDTVTITVPAVVNRAPVANAGPDQSVPPGSTVTLTGAASSDPDNDPLTYTWTQTAGAAVNLSSSTAVSPTFTAPAAGTSVTFSLVVRDTSLSSNPDTVTITVPAAGSSNVARTLTATATASTQNSGDGQTAAKAIDGSPLGYPADYSHEWASVRQGVGAWIQLTWTNPVTLDRVVLYDRPNAADQITSGTLTFSDGSSVAVGSLTNDGTAVPIAFAPRTVTWARLTVNTVLAGTSSVGLAEFEAWGTGSGA